MLIGPDYLNLASAGLSSAGNVGTGPAATPSTTSVRSAGTSDWSRTAAQSPVARESIHRMMSLMKDPEISGMLALMKMDDETANAGYNAVVSAYNDND